MIMQIFKLISLLFLINLNKMNRIAKITFESKKTYAPPKPDINTRKKSDPDSKMICSNTLKENVDMNANHSDTMIRLTHSKLNDTSTSPKNSGGFHQMEMKDIHTFYFKRENKMVMNKYGPELYSYSKNIECINIPFNYIERHKISPQVRTKMIDWMIEVLFAYNCDTPTFFLAVHLLDLYICKARITLCDSDIHLTGIVCIYIASKMEDIIPLRMSHIKNKIGHNKFTEKEIKKREKQILNDIDFDVIATSTYDFVKTFLFDFCLNNKNPIKKLGMQQHIDSLENICVFIAKMLTLNEEFTPFNHSLKAICCIVAGFDVLRSNSPSLTGEMENFIRQWILFLINESQYSSDEIGTVYNKVVELYQQVEKMKYIAGNLIKTHAIKICK